MMLQHVNVTVEADQELITGGLLFYFILFLPQTQGGESRLNTDFKKG